jgi:sirohydrochlorin ferrochelatase
MTGVLIVDHGSREEAANALFVQIMQRFAATHPALLVEPAHMELAPPTIADAFNALVDRGAKYVIVHPYFLLPGRHWRQDIPTLCEEAAQPHPGVRWKVTEPLGMSDLILEVIAERLRGAGAPL